MSELTDQELAAFGQMIRAKQMQDQIAEASRRQTQAQAGQFGQQAQLQGSGFTPPTNARSRST